MTFLELVLKWNYGFCCKVPHCKLVFRAVIPAGDLGDLSKLIAIL